MEFKEYCSNGIFGVFSRFVIIIFNLSVFINDVIK